MANMLGLGRTKVYDMLASGELPVVRILAQGVHPKAVQELLGHSQISLTMDTYSTVLPSVNRETAEQMNAVLKA